MDFILTDPPYFAGFCDRAGRQRLAAGGRMTNYAGLEPLREDVVKLANDIYELLSRLKALES